MNKRVGTLFLVILLSLSLLVVGCGQKSQPAQQAQQAQQAPAAKTPEKPQVIELKMHHHDPPTSYLGTYLANWAKAIEQKSGGKVKITIYPSASLGRANDAYDMVTNGICDIAWGFVGLFPGRFPMTDAIGLPMLGMNSAEVGSKVLWDLYSTTDYLKEEYKDVKVLFLHTHANVPIGLRSKKVEKMEDLKGLKIRTPGGPPLEFLKQLGGTPISMPPTDLFTSLEKSVIDGYMIDWQGVYAFKLGEITKYALDVKVYLGPFWVVMNKNKWNALPDDVKKVFEELSGAKAAAELGKEFDKSEKDAMDMVKKSGGQVYSLSDAEYARFAEKAKATWEVWISDMKKKGLPADKVVEKIQELTKKHSS